MTKTTQARYTLEFKQEAVRLVEGGPVFELLQSRGIKVIVANAS